MPRRATAATASLFAGTPQDGVALGWGGAPVTLVEFADFQCPFCAAFARDTLPELARAYVRTGKVRIELRVLAFIGPDSTEARELALGAAEPNRLWHAADLLFEHQGKTPAGSPRSCSRRYAEVAAVPVALLGLLAYLAILATSLSSLELARAAGAAIALGGLAFSAYLLYVQIALIEALCQWCIASDLVLSALAVLATLRLAPIRGNPQPDQSAR